MQVEILTRDPAWPCFSMTFGGVRFLLDCALDPRDMLRFLPPNVDLGHTESSKQRSYVRRNLRYGCPHFQRFDVASGYQNLTALPFLTEHTEFQGRVFCTEPTHWLAKQVLEELVQLDTLSRQHTQHSTSDAPLTQAELEQLLPAAAQDLQHVLVHWRELYTTKDVASCLGKLECLSFDQPKEVVSTIRATAVSGGLTIGSANWLIETDDRLPCPPGPTQRCSKAVLTAHSAGKSCTWVEQRGSPIDCLGCSDIQSHSRSTDSRGSMLCSSHLSIRARTCHLLRPHAGLDKSPVNGAYRVTSWFPTGFALQNVPTRKTINRGGNVLIPTAPTGLVYDILETLIGYLSSIGLQAKLADPWLSLRNHLPSAGDASVYDFTAIGYSSISAEWLSRAKQDKAFVPEPLFVHSELLRVGHLKCFPSAHHPTLATIYREPCIVYASHPTLRLGEAAFFMKKFKSGPQNLVVLTEAGLPSEELLEPFQPMQMQSLHCPIDLRLRVSEATQVIAKLSPRHVIAPNAYLRCTPGLKAGWQSTVHKLSIFRPVEVPLSSDYRMACVSEELARCVEPETVMDKVALSRFSAMAHVMDGRLELHPRPEGSSETEATSLFGGFSPEALAQVLTDNGIADYEITRYKREHPVSDNVREWDCCVRVGSEAKVYLSHNASHIDTTNEPLRKLLMNCIVSCLPQV